MGQQWPVAGTGVLAGAVLGGMACGINPLGGGRHQPYQRANGWAIYKLENNYTKEVLALLWKLQALQQTSATWGFSKETEYSQGICRSWDLITELPQNRGNKLLEGTDKTLCVPGLKRKEQRPHKRLSQTCLWESGSLQQRCGSTVAGLRIGALAAVILGGAACWHKSSWKRSPLPLP